MCYRAMASVILLVLSALGATARAEDAVTVRLKWFNQAQFAGFYVAQERGYYRAAGLAVNIQPGGPDFPHPLGPSSETNSPRRTIRLKRSIATVSPKRTLRSVIARIGLPWAAGAASRRSVNRSAKREACTIAFIA